MRWFFVLWFTQICLMTLASASLPAPTVVPQLELKNYLGFWYEIASFPGPFQKKCVGSTATYTLRADGDIDVLNQCHSKTLDGEVRAVKGKAWVVDKGKPAKLKVRFFWVITGDYWVVDLGPLNQDSKYSYAVVSGPKRKYLWILSRTPTLPANTLNEIRNRLQGQGFDLARLKMTLQNAP